MPRKADTPCSVCGKLLWSSKSSLPAGERRCRECRAAGAMPPDAAPDVVSIDATPQGEPDWARDTAPGWSAWTPNEWGEW